MKEMRLQPTSAVRISLEGPMGKRVEANLEHWLLVAPQSNPGLIEMFRTRDRQPAQAWVPWAGEFVGKYLISAIQAMRMAETGRLKEQLSQLIPELLETQADDGYLGPFRKEERLLGHWDLWGHYHVMLALLMWEKETGDPDALEGAIRAADLICRTYGGGDRRVLDAGSPEMNMAVIHVLGRLYRKTGTDSYFDLMQEILKDWEQAGDYFRQGLEDVPFYETPRPRWESLHDIQGLLELLEITGDSRFGEAFENLWWSIDHGDRHNSGGFSTGERAIGDPYAPGAIETCCTTAWVALSVDMLRLTADPIVADELERSTWNAVLGSQHPSGRWWTYNTPMAGRREASAHTIVFQARAGTPELNCCSVNGPRGLGALTEWAVLLDKEGPLLNYYGASKIRFRLMDGTECALEQDTLYPVDGLVRIRVSPDPARDFALRLRIPSWSKQTSVAVNGDEEPLVRAGTYLSLKRSWKKGDLIELTLDMGPRTEGGDRACKGKASIYWGPLLLAFDQRFNGLDPSRMPSLDASNLQLRPMSWERRWKPIVLFECEAEDGTFVRLCDFATAGAHGTWYESWLPAKEPPPGVFFLQSPRRGERIGGGAFRFQWRGPARGERLRCTHAFWIARNVEGSDRIHQIQEVEASWYDLDISLENGTYYWGVEREIEGRVIANAYGPSPFVVDRSFKNRPLEPKVYKLKRYGKDDLGILDALDGEASPRVGKIEEATDLSPTEDRKGRSNEAVALNGSTSGILYEIPYFPEENYTALCWVCPKELTDERLGQIFSAWAGGMDDPLRICVHQGQLFARIEAGSAYSTSGIPLRQGEWIHVGAVKDGEMLALFVNGEKVSETRVPGFIYSASQTVGWGTNPRYTGENERLQCDLGEIAFYARALDAEEIQAIAKEFPRRP